MSKKNKKIGKIDAERIEEFLYIFSKESPEIRDEIVKALPSYNILHSLHAKTFEEFALLSLAKEYKLPYNSSSFNYKTIKPVCPHCREGANIRRSGTNAYICSSCGKKYTANHNSISSGSNCSSLTWMKVLYCMLEFYSIKRTCSYCNISINTFYNIRNRIFHGMEIMLKEVKLYGKIECDNTFVRVSYKGIDLDDKDYPEGSLFDTIEFLPRKPRIRGGSYSHNEKNDNYICIFTAIDEYGHSIARYVCIGAANSKALLNAVGKDKFLETVPPDISSNIKTTFLVSDGEFSIKKYAEKLNLHIESRVYRKNGVQMKYPSSVNTIQNVNNLHKKLKLFLRKTNYVSSKYLPGYLVFFDFIENFGTSTEVIGKLFEILAKPDLKKPSSYYQEKYIVHNYMSEKLNSDNPLGYFSEAQLLAFYLYDKRLNDKQNGLKHISVTKIQDLTGYSSSNIRRLHKNFSSSGFSNLIYDYFEGDKESKKEKKRQLQITPELIAAYNEYAIWKKTPSNIRSTKKEFLVEINKKYNLNISSVSTFNYRMSIIQDTGLVEQLPPCESADPNLKYDRYLKYLEIYENIVNEYKRNNIKLPKATELYDVLSIKTGLAPDTLRNYLSIARKHKKENLLTEYNNSQKR